MVYQTDTVGRSTQIPEAVKSETVNEDGVTEVTYYVPYVLDKNEEFVNAFHAAAERGVSGTDPVWNVTFSYTAQYNSIQQNVSAGFLRFFSPIGFSVSYRFNNNSNKEVGTITNLNAVYDIICNLYVSPNCLNVSEPPVAVRNHYLSTNVAVSYPVEGTSYSAVFQNGIPSGYLARCSGSNQSGEIVVTFTFISKSGNSRTQRLNPFLANSDTM